MCCVRWVTKRLQGHHHFYKSLQSVKNWDNVFEIYEDSGCHDQHHILKKNIAQIGFDEHARILKKHIVFYFFPTSADVF